MVLITQILTTPGVDLVGPLPPEIQSYVMFTAGVSANAKVPDAAKQLKAWSRHSNRAMQQTAANIQCFQHLWPGAAAADGDR